MGFFSMVLNSDGKYMYMTSMWTLSQAYFILPDCLRNSFFFQMVYISMYLCMFLCDFLSSSSLTNLGLRVGVRFVFVSILSVFLLHFASDVFVLALTIILVLF